MAGMIWRSDALHSWFPSLLLSLSHPHSCSSKRTGSGGVLLALFPTAANSWPVDLYFSVTPMPASSVSTFAAAENPGRKPYHMSCFSEDRSGWNVEDSLVLILHQRINQFKYKSIDKLFKSLFFVAFERKGENHFRLNN